MEPTGHPPELDRSSPVASHSIHLDSENDRVGPTASSSSDLGDNDTHIVPTSPTSLRMPPRVRLSSYTAHTASQSAPILTIPPFSEISTMRRDPTSPRATHTQTMSPIARAPTAVSFPGSNSAHRGSPPPQRPGNRRGRQRRAPVHSHRSLYRWTRDFMGYGNPTRRRIIRFITHSIWGLFQLVFISTFLGLTRSTWKSSAPDHRGETEWDACSKPIGAWTIAWLIRVGLGVILIFWEYQRTAVQ